MEERPTLNTKISLKDFKDFYWLKSELMDYCRAEGLNTSGGKLEIANRIEVYLKTGKKTAKDSSETRKAARKKSNFDWKEARLTDKTLITNNYKNTENVRNYFQKQIGASFKFNVVFMNWMKTAEGKTLADAVNQWKKIRTEIKNRKEEKEIAPQFEYNTYIRDFLKDNPDKSRKEAIAHWKIKRNSRGDNKYRKSDLRNK